MRPFKVIPEAEFASVMDGEVAPALAAVRTDGTFTGTGGLSLAWHSYSAGDPSAAVVIVHGFTESGEKYDEMAWYFLSQGWSVYVYDQRGHGASGREVADKTLTHVRRFEDYVDDLELFLDSVVPKGLPLYLYSHSMGGAVAALFLERFPDRFEKAVLSSPMVAPSTGAFPPFVGRAICRFMILFGGARKRIFLSKPYPGIEYFKDSCGSSEPRFSRYELFRRTHPDYQNFSPTYRWTLESLKTCRKILKKGAPERIVTRVQIISAGLDDVVLIPPQKELAGRIRGAGYVLFEGGRHELFFGGDSQMSAYLTQVLSFLSEDDTQAGAPAGDR